MRLAAAGGPARAGARLRLPVHEELNDAVKRLPRRWFNWRRKHWRVPADPRVAKSVERVLDRFPGLEATPEVRAWLARLGPLARAGLGGVLRGAGAFILRTLAGEAPPELNEAADAGRRPATCSPSAWRTPTCSTSSTACSSTTWPARCARGAVGGPGARAGRAEHRGGRRRRARGHDLHHLGPAARARVPQALRGAPDRPRRAASTYRDASWGIAVPADPALADRPHRVRGGQPEGARSTSASRSMIAELVAEHERAAATVALSYAEDAELDGLELGGVLHPFQRAGVRYALERRRTFIADEQGLGKTVQALATLEADEAFPAVGGVPREHEAHVGARDPHLAAQPHGGRARRAHRPTTWSGDAAKADIVVLNYDILEAHSERLAARGLRALMLDESHYVKNPRARRTKAALELARAAAHGRSPPRPHRHADPEPPRGARGPAAGARPPRRVRQRRAAHPPLPRRGERRPPALEPARALLRAPHEEAGAAPAARQAPGHGAGAAARTSTSTGWPSRT